MKVIFFSVMLCGTFQDEYSGMPRQPAQFQYGKICVYNKELGKSGDRGLYIQG